MNLTHGDEFLTKEVYNRIATPLITLMTSAETTESYEICYNVLSHIHFIIRKGAASHFEDKFKYFFLKYDEPLYIKTLKLKILSLVATDDSVEEICTELNEYVTDVSHEISKKSILCFGEITVNLPSSASKVAGLIKNFLAIQNPYITEECIVVLVDVFRKYRNMVDEFEEFLTNINFDSLKKVKSKVSYIWILGEFGDKLEAAPYIIERMVKLIKEQPNIPVSLEILTALLKLFFIWAPEVKSMLAEFFKYILTDL